MKDFGDYRDWKNPEEESLGRYVSKVQISSKNLFTWWRFLEANIVDEDKLSQIGIFDRTSRSFIFSTKSREKINIFIIRW